MMIYWSKVAIFSYTLAFEASQKFCMEYRRDRSSGRSYSFCTPLTCCSTSWFLTPTRTTLRSTVLLTSKFFELCEKVSVCIDEGSVWMASNRPQLNHAKTGVLWCSSSCRQHQIPSGPVRIDSTDVQPASFFDPRPRGSSSTMTWAWGPTSQPFFGSCFAALRHIRSVRRSLSRPALLTLVRALIISKVDYCNSVLAGISGQLQDRLQSALNAAVHLVWSWFYCTTVVCPRLMTVGASVFLFVLNFVRCPCNIFEMIASP